MYLMNYMKNIAIVGIGNWGKLLLKEFEIISKVKYCYFLGSKKTEYWLRKNYPKIQIMKNLDDILKSDVDAIVIATPITTHFEISKRALQYKKSIFLEKPMATSKKDASELIKLGKKNHCLIFVGNIFLHHPVLKQIVKITKSDPVQFANFSWNKNGTFKDDIFFNLLSHDLTIALKLFGKPTNSKIIYSKGFISKIDQVIVKFNFNKNKNCFININRISNLKNKSILLKTKKKIILWENDDLFQFDQKHQKYHLIFSAKKQPLKIECKQFIQSLKSKKSEIGISYNVVQILDDLTKQIP